MHGEFAALEKAELQSIRSDFSNTRITLHASLEETLRLLEKALADRMDLFVTKLGEFLKFGPLCGVEVGWNFHGYADVQIAPSVALRVLDALAFHAKHLAGLRARWDAQGHLASE